MDLPPPPSSPAPGSVPVLLATQVEPSPMTQQQQQRNTGEHILVWQRTINFGQDFKFDDDPFQVSLKGIMTAEDYQHSIRAINEALQDCRATTTDHALLAAGPTMLPLIAWAYRTKQRKLMRRRIMQRSVTQFNEQHPKLLMRWVTRPEKVLTIWRRDAAEQEMNR